MFLKKSILCTALVALTSIPLIAQASLIAHNQDKVKYSTVLLDNGYCAGGGLRPKITNPGEDKTFTDLEVRLVCGADKAHCGATIIMSANLDEIHSCKGATVEKVGHATINAASTHISLIDYAPLDPTHWSIDAKDDQQGTINLTVTPKS